MIKLCVFKKEEYSGDTYFSKYLLNKKRVGSRCVTLDKKGKVKSSFQSPQFSGSGWKPISETKVPGIVMSIFQQDVDGIRIINDQFNRRGNG